MAKGNPDHGLRATIRLTTSFVGKRRWRLALLSMCAAVSGFSEAIVLVIIARLAFAIASGDADVAIHVGPIDSSLSTRALIVLAAFLVLGRGVLQILVSKISSDLLTEVLADIRQQMLRKYLRASWAVQSKERSGRLQELVSSFSNTASGSVSLLSQSLVSLFSLLAFAITAFVVNAVAAIAVVIAGVAMAMTMRPLRRSVRARAKSAAEASLAVATDVSELSHGMLEVRVFDVEDAVFDRARTSILLSAERDRVLRFIQSLGPVLYQTLALLLIVACVAVIDVANINRLGAIGGVVLVMVRSLSYAQVLQSNYQSFHAQAPALEMLQAELDRLGDAKVDFDGAPCEHIGEIAFDHVDFHYEAGIPTLVDLSFCVPHGEIIGIVGPSGAGKSTLVQLLLRLRDPVGGRMLVDGRDVRELALRDWYQRVSFVPQDAWLFAGSIAENIAFFRTDATQESIEHAARLANLHDEVTAMPRGYDTPAGERGGQLSGGQRQRLCIARALVDEPDVIVFDEPTSALDVKSEALIREVMANLAPKATVFVIAHRLSTLDVCDRLMVLREGRLEGFDTPERLERSDHFYREALRLSGMR